jgi:hypothetical protein
MPIRKFRSIEEMTPLSDRRPFDPENLRIAIVWSRAIRRLHPVKSPPGVHKFRSYEAMKECDAAIVDYTILPDDDQPPAGR